MDRQWKRLLIGAGAVAGLTALLTRWPPLNDVTTGETPEYPDLQPRLYPQDADRVFLAAQEIGHSTGWKLDEIDPQARTFHAEAPVALTPFVDDVWVSVTGEGDGSVVKVRSKSRVGRGDFGVNARRIEAYLKDLDIRLGAPPP